MRAIWLAEGTGSPMVSGKQQRSFDAEIAVASDAARELIEAILRADQTGESAQTFSVMLRLLPEDDEPIGRLNP